MITKVSVSLDNGLFQDISQAEFNEMKITATKGDEQQFFTEEIGSISFHGKEYDYIDNKPFDTKFLAVVIVKYLVPGSGYAINRMYQGSFSKADCEIDYDNKEFKVKPKGINPEDKINQLKNKKFDIFSDLQSVSVEIEKGAILQMYIANSNTVTSFTQDGQIYDQEVKPEPSSGTLQSREHFYISKIAEYVIYNGQIYLQTGPNEFTFEIAPLVFSYIRRIGGSAIYYPSTGGSTNLGVIQSYLDNSDVTSTTNDPRAFFHRQRICSRFLTRTGTFNNITCHPLADNDFLTGQIPEEYSNVAPYNKPELFKQVTETTPTYPTDFPKSLDGDYFQSPYGSYIGAYCKPISTDKWNYNAIFFNATLQETGIIPEQPFWSQISVYQGKGFTMQSVINALIKRIDSNLSFSESDSKFFYDSVPVSSEVFYPVFMQKSNILEPISALGASKFEISFQEIESMLIDCFRCYWFVSNGRLKIEHISYFRDGKRYYGGNDTLVDLTTKIEENSLLPWAYSTSKVKFDTYKIPFDYTFKWMDNVGSAFQGTKLEMTSAYANKDITKDINVSTITTDVGYMLANPSDINKNGFVLFDCEKSSIPNSYTIKSKSYRDENDERFKLNGYVDKRIANYGFSFNELVHNYYRSDMPTRKYELNGVLGSAFGIKKTMKQDVVFPYEANISREDFYKNIKTKVGDGEIKEIVLDLLNNTAKASLIYEYD